MSMADPGEAERARILELVASIPIEVTCAGECEFVAQVTDHLNELQAGGHIGVENNQFICHMCKISYTRVTDLAHHCWTVHRPLHPGAEAGLETANLTELTLVLSTLSPEFAQLVASLKGDLPLKATIHIREIEGPVTWTCTRSARLGFVSSAQREAFVRQAEVFRQFVVFIAKVFHLRDDAVSEEFYMRCRTKGIIIAATHKVPDPTLGVCDLTLSCVMPNARALKEQVADFAAEVDGLVAVGSIWLCKRCRGMFTEAERRNCPAGGEHDRSDQPLTGRHKCQRPFTASFNWLRS